MWWFSPRPCPLPSCWKEWRYRRTTRRPISCSYDHKLQSSSVIMQQDIMYFQRDHPIYDISVCTHISVLMCVNRNGVSLVHPALCALLCLQPRIWESSCLHTLLPSFENEFPIALLKSAFCQWVWHQHCSSVGVFGLWEEGPVGQRTVQFIIKRKARKWLFLCNVIEKEKGKDIVVISSLSHADIAPINHIS